MCRGAAAELQLQQALTRRPLYICVTVRGKGLPSCRAFLKATMGCIHMTSIIPPTAPMAVCSKAVTRDGLPMFRSCAATAAIAGLFCWLLEGYLKLLRTQQEGCGMTGCACVIGGLWVGALLGGWI